MAKYGYARVSSADQNAERQIVHEKSDGETVPLAFTVGFMAWRYKSSAAKCPYYRGELCDSKTGEDGGD